MAGIGFELKKLFGDNEDLTKKVKAYMYSAFVSVGPWITTIITLNLLNFISDIFIKNGGEKQLFMGTIVYSFVFSQISTTPWQLLITRYISDKLYMKEYKDIRASLFGLTKVTVLINFIFAFLFYFDKDLPIYYKFFSIAIFLIISLTWITMVYLSAIKNYNIISKSFVIGSAVSVGLTFLTLKFPVNFPQHTFSTNILLSYLVGAAITYVGLVYSFLRSFEETGKYEYEFFIYFNKTPSLFFIGLFYILGLWVDDIIVWFSSLGIDIFSTFRFAPLYDNAIFFAYLSTIPTYILFIIAIETEFYDSYKKYFSLISKNGTYDEIESAREKTKKIMWREIIYVMEIQALVTITFIVLSGPIFTYMRYPKLMGDIFRIAALGAYCNAFLLILILVMLYFEFRIKALLTAFIFFILNVIFTYIFIPYGETFFGAGCFTGSLISLILGIVILSGSYKNLTYFTFFRQPMFLKTKMNIIDRIFLIFEKPKNVIEKEKKKIEIRPTYYLYAAMFFTVTLVIAIFGFMDIKGGTRLVLEMKSEEKLNTLSMKNIEIIGHEVKNWSEKIANENLISSEKIIENTNIDLTTKSTVELSKKLVTYTSDYSVYFDFDSASIKKQKNKAIVLAEKRIKKYLKGRKKIKVILVGYADSKGDFEYNMILSEDRAAAVRAALRSKIRNKNVVYVILAKGRIEQGNTEDESKNRRVDISIIK